MKISFYIENQNIKGVDLSRPELGNPGIGGTEFNFITLIHSIKKYNPKYDCRLFANETTPFSEELPTTKAESCNDAIEQAILAGYEFFIWRPTVREDAKTLINRITDFDIKIIIWAHNTPALEYLDALSRARNVVRFIPVGIEQNRLIGKHPIQAKATVIHNGFDPSKYQQSRVSKDTNSVVYLGSLISVKGFGMLAKVWKRINTIHPHAKLTVIGGGNLYNRNMPLGPLGIAEEKFELEEIIPYLCDQNGEIDPSIEFLGVLGNEKIPLLADALIGIVNPTGKGENCPGSAIEFLASSTPVISADSEGLLDVVEHNVTGLLGNGEQALINNICELLSNPKKATKLGKNGPAVIAQKFNHKLACQKWGAIFMEETDTFVEPSDFLSSRYFPYITYAELLKDKALRAALEKLQLPTALKIYSIWTFIKKNRMYVRFKTENNMYKAVTNKESIYFPGSIPSVKWLHASLHYSKWLKRKYTLPGFVEIEDNDLVFDCGSFVGGFTIAALEKNATVHLFEPSSVNTQCIENNLAGHINYKINNAGLFNKTTNIEFNISPNPVENSILQPDDNQISHTVNIKVWRIDDYCKENKINKIDFLKIEAEGVEEEIIYGIGDITINKIAIDCSPERNGESPLKQIKAFLQSKGFTVRRRGWNLYARPTRQLSQKVLAP